MARNGPTGQVGPSGGALRTARVATAAELVEALQELGLDGGRPVVVVVGGAGAMSDDDVNALASTLSRAVLPALGDAGVLVDGGTDAGVMRAAGRARTAARLACRLVGVAAEGTVAEPAGSASAPDAPGLEPGHTDIILVPGHRWGDESTWIGRVATAIADGDRSVTVLANGGSIAEDDVERSLAAGRPVVVLAGSGRLADEIVAAVESPPPGSRVTSIAHSALTLVVDMRDDAAVREVVEDALHPARGNP